MKSSLETVVEKIDWITKHTSFYKEALEIAETHCGLVSETEDPKWKLPLSMYCRAIELVGGIGSVDKSGLFNVGNILCRSFLELHIDFLLALLDSDYEKQLRRNELPGEIALEKSLNNPTDDLEEELKNLNSLGFKKMTILGKFKALENYPGHQDIYNSIYRTLCVEAHNSSRSLLGSHMLVSGRKMIFGSSSGMSEQRFKVLRKQVALSLCMMSRLLHDAWGTEKSVYFTDLLSKWDEKP